MPPEVDREFLEYARRRNPEAVSRIEKSPAYGELRKAGVPAGAVALFCLDCADWQRLDELRRWRKQIILAHRRLEASHAALKELPDLEPVLSSLQVAIELPRLEPGRMRLTSEALREMVEMIASYTEELGLIAGKLAAPRGRPRSFSRDFFMSEFRRRVVPPQVRARRSLDGLAAKLYSELFRYIDIDVYVRARRRRHPRQDTVS
ncbi:MAG TPA: hypothetical protein VGY99_16995 [Candidatus Binataceae bacterium]|nr:hypothetical protein [Candidatus Binataceae bacterium]